MKIGEFEATLTRARVGDTTVALWRVAELERHVDRAALLGAGRVLELGCGLGLPGLVAACRGARVTFLDRVPTALAFVRASARANGLAAVDLVAADATVPALAARFDLVLAAELVYDRAAFPALARALAAHLAPGGRALLADAGRIDTRVFYAELDAAGLAWRARAEPVREEG